MLSWIKKKLGIVDLERKLFEQGVRIKATHDYVDGYIKQLNEFTRADVDIGRSSSSIILTGVYQGRGFVQFYDLSSREFDEVLHIVRGMTRGKNLRNVDKPYDFHGSFDL